MEIKVGLIYDIVPVLTNIGKQEMSLEEAEKVAEAIEGITHHLAELEGQRLELVEKKFDKEEERMEAFEKFGAEKREIPDIDFKNFPSLRLAPNDILVLKNAGLFAKPLKS